MTTLGSTASVPHLYLDKKKTAVKTAVLISFPVFSY